MTPNTKPTEYPSPRPQPLHASAAAANSGPNGVAVALDVPGELVEQIARRAATIAAELERPIASPWLDTKGAAEHLACGTDRIYDLVQLGKLHPRRDGRRLLFRPADLDAYVEANR
jgi:excisionase family DNA binding protein